MKEERYKNKKDRPCTTVIFFGVTYTFLLFQRYLTVTNSFDQKYIEFLQLDTAQAASGKNEHAKTGRETASLQFLRGHFLPVIFPRFPLDTLRG